MRNKVQENKNKERVYSLECLRNGCIRSHENMGYQMKLLLIRLIFDSHTHGFNVLFCFNESIFIPTAGHRGLLHKIRNNLS